MTLIHLYNFFDLNFRNAANERLEKVLADNAQREFEKLLGAERLSNDFKHKTFPHINSLTKDEIKNKIKKINDGDHSPNGVDANMYKKMNSVF